MTASAVLDLLEWSESYLTPLLRWLWDVYPWLILLSVFLTISCPVTVLSYAYTVGFALRLFKYQRVPAGSEGSPWEAAKVILANGLNTHASFWHGKCNGAYAKSRELLFLLSTAIFQAVDVDHVKAENLVLSQFSVRPSLLERERTNLIVYEKRKHKTIDCKRATKTTFVFNFSRALRAAPPRIASVIVFNFT